MIFSIKRLMLTLPAVMLTALVYGQTSTPVLTPNQEEGNGAVVDGREVTLHKVVYYKITESENYEHSHSVVLREVAEFMQRCPDATVTVVGYADRGTGNAQLNVMYAMNRATKFKDDLITRYAIDASRIVTDSRGDREQPFSDNDLNRCVIVEGRGHERAVVQQQVPHTATEIADRQRQQAQEEKTRRYQEERDRRSGRVDTVVVVKTDTVWMADVIGPEQPFGLQKARRWRNWFISLGVGPAIFQGDHNVDAEWKDRIYPAFNFRIGKWIYPALGFRFGVDLDKVHNYYNANARHPNPLAFKDGVENYGEFVHGASPNEPYEKAPWLYRMDYNAWNFHADVMINFSSFIWSPYTRRFWNLIGYAGIGCISTLDNGVHDWFNYATSLNVGILNSFRICERFDLNIDLHLKKFDDDFNCFRQGRGMDGMTNLTIGGTWYFMKRGF